MTKFNYEDFYEKIGLINGWDFSDIQTTLEGVQWNFYDEVKRVCQSDDILLDIGTGGGESILDLSAAALLVIGIDLSSGMIETAKRNLENSDVSNVRFTQMNGDKLMFPESFFDIVLSRHAPFNAKELARVLSENGTFLTQQVSEGDKENVTTYFNRGQASDVKDGSLKERYVEELTAAGFSKIDVYDYNAVEYFHRPEDLLFLLTHTPIIPNFGEDPSDYTLLEGFIRENKTAKGIMTNSKRFMIIARR